jgi:acyl-CoA thioester hydrolase
MGGRLYDAGISLRNAPGMSKPPFRYLLRVRYGECDAQGVVYNPRYGEYVDLAGTEFLRAALAPRSAFDGSVEYQVVKLLIEWRAPARFDDILDISVQCTSLGTTSMTLGFEMRRLGTNDALVTAQSVMVHVDNTTWTKRALPPFLREAIEGGARGQVVNHAGTGSA